MKLRWMAMVVAIAGCKGEAPQHTPVEVATTSAPPAPAPPPTPPYFLPADGSLPAPYSVLRPHMKIADAMDRLGLKDIVRDPPRYLAYRKGQSVHQVLGGVYGSLAPDADRFEVLYLRSPSGDALAAIIPTAWGAGRSERTVTTWDTKSGWKVELETGKHDGNEQMEAILAGRSEEVPAYAELRYELQAAEPTAPALEWTVLGKLVGQPVEAATKVFGDALQLERADGVRAEATPDTQGYLRLAVPWDDGPWPAILEIDGQRVTRIKLSGGAPDDAARRSLVKSLETAFGPRHAVVNDLGAIEVGFGTGALDVRAIGDAQWNVVIGRR